MKRKQINFLSTGLLTLLFLSIVLVSCSEEENGPGVTEVSGTYSAKVSNEGDFAPDVIEYTTSVANGTQIMGKETSSKRGLEIIFTQNLTPGTYTYTSGSLDDKVHPSIYGDFDVLLSRETATEGTFTLKKYDADSLVANFNFTTQTRIVTQGVIKLKLK